MQLRMRIPYLHFPCNYPIKYNRYPTHFPTRPSNMILITCPWWQASKLKARSTQSTYQTHQFQKISKQKTLHYSLEGSERHTLIPSGVAHPRYSLRTRPPQFTHRNPKLNPPNHIQDQHSHQQAFLKTQVLASGNNKSCKTQQQITFIIQNLTSGSRTTCSTARTQRIMKGLYKPTYVTRTCR